VALALLVAFGGGAAWSGGGPPEVAAVVEGRSIRTEELRMLVDGYLDSRAGQDLAREAGRRGVEQLVLGLQVRRRYLEHLAASMGVEAQPDARAEALAALAEEDAYQEAGYGAEDFASARRAGQMSHAIAEKVFPQVSITEGEVRQAFHERAAILGPSWKLAGELAILPSADAARTLRWRVHGGEPFPVVATSLGAAASAQVEITPLSPLPKAIIDAVGGLQADQISGPIQAGDRWAALKVDRRQDTPGVTFEQLEDDLTRFLGDQRRQQLFSDWFAEKLETAQVWVERRFGRWDPATGSVR
jgi:hypothetical protein